MTEENTHRFIVSYPLSATASGVADHGILSNALTISGLSQQPDKVLTFPLIVLRFAAEISIADKSILDAIVAVHQGGTTRIDVIKVERNILIDVKTTALIENGTFVYDGKLFSMSKVAQFNTLVIYTRRNDVGFVYPVVRSTKDNTGSISLADAAAVEAFEAAQESAVRGILDAGNALKALVNAAQIIEEVNAIEDTRGLV